MLRDHGATLEEVIIDDRTMARTLQDLMDRQGEKIRVRWHNGTMPAFDIDDVAGQIDTALASRIALESGVEVLFEPGETLCAVDVDSAGAGGRQGRAPRRRSTSISRRPRRSPSSSGCATSRARL